MNPARAVPQADPPVLVMTREFDAPPHLVYEAWTQARHLANWHAPRGFEILSFEADARTGGRYRVGMRSPQGEVHWAHGVYRELEPPRRLVFTMAWEEADGRPKHETLVRIEMAEAARGTRLTLTQSRFESVASRDGHQEGWSTTLARLAAQLEHLIAERSAP